MCAGAIIFFCVSNPWSFKLLSEFLLDFCWTSVSGLWQTPIKLPLNHHFPPFSTIKPPLNYIKPPFSMVKSPCKPSVASDALGNLGAPPTWFRPHQKGPGVRRSEPGGFVMGIPIPRWRIGGSPMFGNPHVRTIYISLYITFYTGEDHNHTIIQQIYVYIYIIHIYIHIYIH